METEVTRQSAKPERAAVRLALSPTDLALFAVVLVWGFGYVTFKVGQREVPTGLFNLLRAAISVAVLWICLFLSKQDWRMPRKDWGRTLMLGFVGVLVYNMVFSTAAKLTSAANCSLLVALSPIWGVVISWVKGKGVPGVSSLLGSVVAFTGAALVIAFGAGGGLEFSLKSLGGDLTGVAAGMIFAWYAIEAGPLLIEHSGIKVQAWINLVALVGMVIWQGPAAFQFDWSVVSLPAWLSVLYVGAMVAAFAHILWYTAIAKVGPEHVMLALYLVPAFAAGSGAVFLGQPFGLVQIVGAAVALLGVALVRRGMTNRRSALALPDGLR